MGYYIETPWRKNKAKCICEATDAVIIEQPKSFDEVPKDKGLICVVDNGPFEAAAFCYDEREFAEFIRFDGRPKTWLIMSLDMAKKLSNFK